MQFRIIAGLFMLCTSLLLTAQNKMDDQGRRIGTWKGYYPDNTIRYEGTFREGKPVGMMRRYDNDGNLAVTLNYRYQNPERCFATVYSPEGEKDAEGVYQQRQKDSLWIYYGANGTLRLKENYRDGILHGETAYYYPTGNISQQLNYREGRKNGTWMKYFDSGDTMMTAVYAHDTLSGPYKTYYEEGGLQVSGHYSMDLKDGNWDYLSMEGDTMFVLQYNMGTLMNPEVMEARYEEFIQAIEKNEGNMPDPASAEF